MANVVFRSRALCARCAQLETMTAAWGNIRAQLIHRKLQQLAAAVDLDDLSFLPGVTAQRNGDRVEIELDEGMLIVVSDGSQYDVDRGLNYEKSIVVEQIRISKKGTR